MVAAAKLSTVAVAVAFIIQAIGNALASYQVFGADNAVISNSHPTWVTPDGVTFSVWGVIYMLEALMLGFQFFATPHAEQLLSKKCTLTGLDVRWRIAIAYTIPAIWQCVFCSELFFAACLLMVMYLVALIFVYKDLNVTHTESPTECFLLTAGIAANLSWVVVATTLSFFTCAGEGGWKVSGVAGSPTAGVIACFFVTGLAFQRMHENADIAYALVAGWALRGIYRMQTVEKPERFPLEAMNRDVALVANVLSLTVWAGVGACVVDWLLQRRKKKINQTLTTESA